jgi:23S rRNA-/tRNA-specific pseudouridylate synthase
VYEDENFYVVDKPPDMICHESSQQYYNSLQQILLNEYKVPPPLHLVHRLDGVTSGIVIFSKNSKIQSE